MQADSRLLSAQSTFGSCYKRGLGAQHLAYNLVAVE